MLKTIKNLAKRRFTRQWLWFISLYLGAVLILGIFSFTARFFLQFA